MKINVKGTNLKLTPDIYEYIEEKIGGLDKFIEHVDSVVQAWVEVDKTTKHHKTGKIYRAEIQIRMPGKGVRAEARNKTIFLAIDEAKNELQRELKKYKGRQSAKQKRGARISKKQIHSS